MGSIKLYQQQSGSIGMGNVFHAFGSVIARGLDDIISNVKEMIESKLILFALTLIGIPCGIFAYFLEVNPNFDLIKGIILLVIGSGTGLIIAARYLIKFLTELQEYKKKYHKR